MRQQHHHRPGGLPPPAPQAGLQLLDLAAWTFGEHTDRAHTDHDLAGWVDVVWQLRSNPGEADVNALQLPVSQRVLARSSPQADWPTRLTRW